MLGLAEAGAGGFFDDGGFPAGQGWDQIAFPGLADDSAYALQVSGDSMLPLYRNGDIIIVSPAARIRRGDRVVVKTAGGEVMAKILKRQSSAELELGSFNPEHPSRSVSVHEVDVDGPHPLGEPVAGFLRTSGRDRSRFAGLD